MRSEVRSIETEIFLAQFTFFGPAISGDQIKDSADIMRNKK